MFGTVGHGRWLLLVATALIALGVVALVSERRTALFQLVVGLVAAAAVAVLMATSIADEVDTKRLVGESVESGLGIKLAVVGVAAAILGGLITPGTALRGRYAK